MLLLTKCRNVISPFKATSDAGAWDFCVPNDQEPLVLEPSKGVVIPSGIKAIVPKGHALIAYNKSGLGRKLIIKTSEFIDCDYYGEIHLCLTNVGVEPLYIKPGMPIVQFALHVIDNNPYVMIDQSTFDELIAKIPSERQVAKFGEMTAKYMKELTNVLDTETRNELKLKM
jgi:dUTPase